MSCLSVVDTPAIAWRLFLQVGCTFVAIAIIEKWPLYRSLSKNDCVDQCLKQKKKQTMVER